MTIGLSAVIFSSIALVVLAGLSIFKAQQLKVQLWYILFASFFSGVLFIVGLNSEAYTIMLWPAVVMFHVVNKLLQISKKIIG